MSSHACISLVASAVVIAMCVATKASAQGGAPPRAPNGVFGAVRSDTKTKLNVIASVLEGYDDDVPTQVTQAIDPSGLQSGGFSTIVNASAGYSWHGKRTELTATAASDVRRYARVGETRSAGHSAGAGVSFRLPSRTSLLFNEGYAYSPTYMYGLFPTGPTVELGSTPTSAPDYSVTRLASNAYSSMVGIQHEITTRARLSANGDYTYSDRLHETPQFRDVSAHSIHVEYSQNLRRDAALTAQYRYRKGAFGYAGEGQTVEHGLDFGANLSKRLSATRRASLDLRIGVSSTDVPSFIGATEPFVFVHQYVTVGQVGFGYDIGRTWEVKANYRRGVEYVVDLPQPVFADGAGVSVGGMLSRRVDAVFSVAFSSGASLLNKNSLLFDTYTGDARVRYAFTRTLATYAEYLYYYYDFRGNAKLAEGIPSGVKRNGVRAGLTLWLPAL